MWNVKNLLMLTQEQLLDAINQWYPTGTSEQFLRMLDGEVQSILNAIAQGRTLAAMVREAVIFYLAHHEPKRKD